MVQIAEATVKVKADFTEYDRDIRRARQGQRRVDGRPGGSVSTAIVGGAVGGAAGGGAVGGAARRSKEEWFEKYAPGLRNRLIAYKFDTKHRLSPYKGLPFSFLGRDINVPLFRSNLLKDVRDQWEDTKGLGKQFYRTGRSAMLFDPLKKLKEQSKALQWLGKNADRVRSELADFIPVAGSVISKIGTVTKGFGLVGFGLAAGLFYTRFALQKRDTHQALTDSFINQNLSRRYGSLSSQGLTMSTASAYASNLQSQRSAAMMSGMNVPGQLSRDKIDRAIQRSRGGVAGDLMMSSHGESFRELWHAGTSAAKKGWNLYNEVMARTGNLISFGKAGIKGSTLDALSEELNKGLADIPAKLEQQLMDRGGENAVLEYRAQLLKARRKEDADEYTRELDKAKEKYPWLREGFAVGSISSAGIGGAAGETVTTITSRIPNMDEKLDLILEEVRKNAGIK